MLNFSGPDLPQRLKTDRYPDENGNMVMTEKFLIDRGVCCGMGCRHCPYTPRHSAGNRKVSHELGHVLENGS
ncbi:MAG: hypothetical protein HN366_07295 [Deltaproteobacteria bacterium]|nr:hypothetical protein [Deltaproteobacteria bacterium]